MEACHWHAFAEHVAVDRPEHIGEHRVAESAVDRQVNALRDRASLYAVSASARLLFSNTITAVAVFETGA